MDERREFLPYYLNELGYLRRKHPDNVRTVAFPFGDAHVFFPEAEAGRCTAAVLVEVDPIGLIRRRGRKGPESFSLAGYVNDRPYVASSFLSVVVGKVFVLLWPLSHFSWLHRPDAFSVVTAPANGG